VLAGQCSAPSARGGEAPGRAPVAIPRSAGFIEGRVERSCPAAVGGRLGRPGVVAGQRDPRPGASTMPPCSAAARRADRPPAGRGLALAAGAMAIQVTPREHERRAAWPTGTRRRSRRPPAVASASASARRPAACAACARHVATAAVAHREPSAARRRRRRTSPGRAREADRRRDGEPRVPPGDRSARAAGRCPARAGRTRRPRRRPRRREAVRRREDPLPAIRASQLPARGGPSRCSRSRRAPPSGPGGDPNSRAIAALRPAALASTRRSPSRRARDRTASSRATASGSRPCCSSTAASSRVSASCWAGSSVTAQRLLEVRPRLRATSGCARGAQRGEDDRALRLVGWLASARRSSATDVSRPPGPVAASTPVSSALTTPDLPWAPWRAAGRRRGAPARRPREAPRPPGGARPTGAPPGGR
jgi:hypothetical protein